jgi:hypothetical protein
LPDLVLPSADADAGPTRFCGDGIVDLDAEQCDPGANDAAIGCTQSCMLDCEGGALDPQSSHCYFWTTATDTLEHASTYCSIPGGHLVGFADDDELSFVASNTKTIAGAPDGGGGSWAWLQKTGTPNEAGLDTYYVPGPAGVDLPGWAASCPGCYANADGGDGGGFALAGQNPQLCVFWKRTASQGWVQQVCSFTGNTVTPLCEREPLGAFSSPCPDDAGNTCIRIPRTAKTKRYELTLAAASFDNARASCAARGGMLARFDSGAEREEVIAEVARMLGPGGDVWIGLVFDTGTNKWTWVDGTPAPPKFPTPWADGEPMVNAGAATIHLELGRYDTRLAHAQADTTATYRALCEFK